MKEYLEKKNLLLGFQHLLAMFGATVLVPVLTGLNPSISLLTAGIGTLLFHLVTKRVVPVFLGSSFAFIGAIALTLKGADGTLHNIAQVKAGIIAAGLVYILMATVIKIFGVDKVKSFFPPIVTGPIIMVIGLRLSPEALKMAGYDAAHNTFDWIHLSIALIVIITMITVSVLEKSYFRLVPILIAVSVGYIFTLILWKIGIFDYTGASVIRSAKWIGFSSEAAADLFSLPKFTLNGIMAIAPIAFVVFIEHIGDIATNGAVVGKNFFENPGIHRTMFGDGIATLTAGFLGGPANTTYSENTGVLAVTKVYNPAILRIAAVYAIAFSVIGKFGAILSTIPLPVMGGVSIILFGMIASVGVRTLIEAELDFAHSRNLIIASLILVFGIAIKEVLIPNTSVNISGLAVAAVIGVLLNKLLPKNI